MLSDFFLLEVISQNQNITSSTKWRLYQFYIYEWGSGDRGSGARWIDSIKIFCLNPTNMWAGASSSKIMKVGLTDYNQLY